MIISDAFQDDSDALINGPILDVLSSATTCRKIRESSGKLGWPDGHCKTTSTQAMSEHAQQRWLMAKLTCEVDCTLGPHQHLGAVIWIIQLTSFDATESLYSYIFVCGGRTRVGPKARRIRRLLSDLLMWSEITRRSQRLLSESTDSHQNALEAQR